LNVTVTNTQGPGFILIYPAGGSQPTVSTLNYVTGQTVANAAIVPLGTGGAVTVVAGVSGTDLIIDVNGYYSSAAGYQGSSFMVINSGADTVPAIWGETTSTNLNATGVFGLASATTGITDGVWGRNFSNSDFSTGVIGISEGTSGLTFGVYGRSNSTSSGAIGTYGEALGTSGRTYGVLGVDLSTSFNSAGVRGVGASGPALPSSFFNAPAGVLGEAKFGQAVIGASWHEAVNGQLYNSTGAVAFGSLGTTLGTASDATVGPWGVFAFGNLGASGSKHFVEPHPADPKKVILYSTVEGRTVDTTFRGTARLVDHTAVIEVPEDFRIVTDEEGLTVQVTPVGAYSQIYVESQDMHRIVVRGSKDVPFHYQVTGLRRAFKDLQPVQTGYVFMPQSPSDRIPAYLTEEARRRLISNGTYNEDGTVNMVTAEKAGFTRIWAERQAQIQAAAREAQQRMAAQKGHP
jgi:hypothetical protein